MPEGNADKKNKIKWLIDICKKHVEKYVVLLEVSTLVEQFHCCKPDSEKSFKLHSRRVM